jgi:transposase, IS30 family
MSQLQYKDCITIETLLKIWRKSNAIANYVWVNKSTISNELSKYSENWKYNGAIAWTKRQLLMALRNKEKPRIKKGSELEKYILKNIKKYRSPEQIAWKRRKKSWEKLSKDTIYMFIYQYHPNLIKKYFRRRWKKYTKHWQKRGMIENLRSIDLREESVNNREKIWDREWDSIEDWTHKARIITQVDRKSWYLLTGLSQNKKWTEISKLIYNMFKEIPKGKQKTMTLDQWMEFKDHKVIECTTGMKVYFCHRASPREKWTNENTNGLLRQFIPKWTKISTITAEMLEKYTKIINNRPRKRLWYNTPDEVFHKKVAF